MSISPINFNGMIQNTNEISHTKANEDAKPELQQSNLTQTVEKKQEQQSKQVVNSQNAAKAQNEYDREGSGKGYQGNKNGKQNPKEKPSEQTPSFTSDGKVSTKPSTTFDMRI